MSKVAGAIFVGSLMLGISGFAQDAPAVPATPPASPAVPATPPASPAAPAPPTAKPTTELPPGPGRDTVMRVCSKCHSPNILVANPRDRQGWEDTITKMSGIGAEATDAEFTEILEYLVKNVSPKPASPNLNINQASAAELESALGLSPDVAYSVLAYRTRYGSFKSADELARVPGMSGKVAGLDKAQLTF